MNVKIKNEFYNKMVIYQSNYITLNSLLKSFCGDIYYSIPISLYHGELYAILKKSYFCWFTGLNNLVVKFFYSGLDHWIDCIN